VNDILKVESNFIKQMRLVIYDRWGKVVFETTNKDEGWDGTFNNADLAPDVYAFVLQVTCSNGADYGTQGNVTLIR
jgi:gliding motility-associated-like protein